MLRRSNSTLLSGGKKLRLTLEVRLGLKLTEELKQGAEAEARGRGGELKR
jgi:hypothetical protein